MNNWKNDNITSSNIKNEKFKLSLKDDDNKE